VALSDGYPDAWGGWAWSPNGRQIAFIKPGASGRIGILDLKRNAAIATASVATRAVGYQGILSPLAEYAVGWTWVKPGRLAAVQKDRVNPRLLRLAVIDVAAGKVWQIPATLSTRVIDKSSLVTQLTSPLDGKQIALFAVRPGSTTPNVVVADLVRHTTRILGAGTTAAFSPDGGRIAIVNTTSAPKGCGDLRIVTLQEGRTSPIPKPSAACDRLPQWSRDGSKLIFTRTQATVDTVLAASPDGSDQHPLAPIPASSVVWPTDCRQIDGYQAGWLLPDNTGALQLIRRPELPTDWVTAWRC
jgi:hypothetical protein